MRKLLLVGVALASSGIPAFAADMAVKAPRMPVAPPFTWTSCYLGAHAGGGWTNTDIKDPVALVQATPATQTTNLSPSGAVVGGQFGCDYQFAPSWVVGAEGAAAGATMKSSTAVGLPQGIAGDGATVTARTDFLASATARLGYAVDHWLFYGKGGAAWAGGKYSVTGAFGGNGFGFEGLDTRTGWTAGAGIEWAFAPNWSARIEYDYYGFGTRTVSLTDNTGGLGTGTLDIKQNVQTVKLGINFHVWGGQ